MTKLNNTKLCFAGMLVAGLLASQPATAGITYTMVTTGSGAGAEVMSQTAKGYVSGEKLRVDFVESGNPIMGKGTYVLSQDAGRTMLLVNPKDKTYATFDVEAMMGAATSMLKALGPMAQISFSKPSIEKLLDEPGPSLLGLPTTHYKFRTTYSMDMKVMGMKMGNASVVEEELWSTTAFDQELAMAAWLRKGVKTGDESFDALIEAEMNKSNGLPLKRVAVTTNTDAQGRKTTTTQTTEMTAIDQNAVIPPGTFTLPPGYKETQLIPTAAGMPAMFGGKPN